MALGTGRTSTALLALFTLGCSNAEVAAPTGEVMLLSLQFASGEFGTEDPLVVVGRTAGGAPAAPQPLTIHASSGAQVQTSFTPLPLQECVEGPCPRRDPWRHVSDADLAALIGTWGNIVMIGFKEAGTDGGVDDRGRNLVSAETSERMTEWLRQLGVVIVDEWILTPGVTGTLIPDPALVRQIREHENIDYVNPSGPGEFESQAAVWGQPNLLAVSRAGHESTSGLKVRAGETVTAEYRQPDGSVLRATASIR